VRPHTDWRSRRMERCSGSRANTTAM
jgi:hypothetical protein